MSRFRLEHYYSKSCPEEVFRGFYRKYEEMHRREGLLDFDDMMTMTYELLTQQGGYPCRVAAALPLYPGR